MGNRRAFWAALTLVIALTASCTSILGINNNWHPVLQVDGVVCLNDEQCNDMNSCTDDACPAETKVCSNVARPDLSDAPVQQPGDCHRTLCVGGMEEAIIDTADSDDQNDCTIDACDASGNPGHTAKPAKTPCTSSGQSGECNASGKCLTADGIGCSSNGECLSMNCVDLVCCNLASCGTCQACNVLGSVGTCTNVPAGMSDDTCMAPNACDGNGMCVKAANGAACSSGADCASTHCVDGFCCMSSTCGVCESCKESGHLGTCWQVPNNATDDTCMSPMKCNNLGMCQ